LRALECQGGMCKLLNGALGHPLRQKLDEQETGCDRSRHRGGVQTCNKHFGTPKDREACTSESRSRLLSDTGNAREKDRLNERGLKTPEWQIEVINTVQSIRGPHLASGEC
jgi:hypothetical protein